MTVSRLVSSGLRFGWADFEDGWGHSGVDYNWVWIDALLASVVQAQVNTVPTDGLALGYLYLLPDKIACRVADVAADGTQVPTWDYLTPVVGMEFYNVATKTKVRWTGTAWKAANPMAISFFAPGLLTDAKLIGKFHVPVDMFISGVGGVWANTYATCEFAPTAACAISLLKNGGAFARLSFIAGATAANITLLQNDVSFVPGDVITVQGPEVADETFAGLAATLSAFRRAQ